MTKNALPRPGHVLALPAARQEQKDGQEPGEERDDDDAEETQQACKRADVRDDEQLAEQERRHEREEREREAALAARENGPPVTHAFIWHRTRAGNGRDAGRIVRERIPDGGRARSSGCEPRREERPVRCLLLLDDPARGKPLEHRPRLLLALLEGACSRLSADGARSHERRRERGFRVRQAQSLDETEACVVELPFVRRAERRRHSHPGPLLVCVDHLQRDATTVWLVRRKQLARGRDDNLLVLEKAVAFQVERESGAARCGSEIGEPGKPVPASSKHEMRPPPRKHGDPGCEGGDALLCEPEERDGLDDRRHPEADDHEGGAEDVDPPSGHVAKRGERCASRTREAVRSDCAVRREHEDGVEEDDRRLGAGATADERPTAWIALQDEASAQRCRQVAEVCDQDHAEDDRDDGGLERPSAGERNLCV